MRRPNKKPRYTDPQLPTTAQLTLALLAQYGVRFDSRGRLLGAGQLPRWIREFLADLVENVFF